MLSGEYHYAMDPKGRLNFPAKLREELGEQFVLAKSLTDPCINVYPMDAWTQLVTKVDQMPVAKSRNIKRHLFASAIEILPDKQGRILVPPNLRTYGEIEKDVVIVGVSNNCEIWSATHWAALCASMEAEDLAQVVEELGL